MGGEKTRNAGRGHAASVRVVPNRFPEGGDGRAPGSNLPYPGDPWEALDGGAGDYGERDGRIFATWGRCTKTGDQVMEVLRTKHPEARTPTAASLDSYPGCLPELTPVDITEDTVTAVAGRLSGGAGPGGERLRVPSTLAPVVRRGKRGA